MSETLFPTDEPGGPESGDAAATRTPVPRSNAPLAVRMRPRRIDELIGQGHLLAEGSSLRTAIDSGRPHSMILHGPPGAGKTTLARIVAAAADGAFEEESAVNAGRQQVREVLERAAARRKSAGRPTIFFLDEIHRFNKAQQDALLPAVEEGLVTLIGATTENPYFEVNGALISRCQLYELEPISTEDVVRLLDRALADPERGIADPPEADRDALEMLAERSGGDVRTALGALERAAETAKESGGRLDMQRAEDALQQRALRFDKAGDRHYDYASAFIKSIRGSDPDAGIYYLAAMLEGGEDPRFIARRLVILASEDVGNADPQAIVVANSCALACDRVGMPEARLILAQAVTYLALAPKSNAVTTAIGRATGLVRERGAALPPDPLRDGHYPGAKQLGRGQGYVYPHDQPDAFSAQQLAPDEVAGTRFYEPTDRGAEARLGERLAELRRRRSGGG
ncbi:replication-associated recombination protein A [Thermoleophilia bacterium SCSIO 60948]|nr:replication-associated recombination protein A [Thermoleophilia bacterium SCSIO 60948]